MLERDNLKGTLKRIHQSGLDSAEQLMPKMDISVLIDAAKRYGSGETKEDIISSIAEMYRPALSAYMDQVARESIEELTSSLKNVNWKKISKNEYDSKIYHVGKNIGALVVAYYHDEISELELFDAICNKQIQELIEPTLNVFGYNKDELLKNGDAFLNLWSSTIGYAAAVKAYDITMEALNDASTAFELRLEKEAQASKLIKIIKQYQTDIEETVRVYLKKHLTVIDSGFSQMNKALFEGSSDEYIKGNTEIQNLLEYHIQFHNQEEFDGLMNSELPLKL